MAPISIKLVEAQDKDELGTIVYYESEDLLNWRIKGEITTEYKGNGFMWECLDYIELEDKGILFSPQGLQPEGDKYHNGDNTGYLVGDKINFENWVFNHGDFTELDREKSGESTVLEFGTVRKCHMDTKNLKIQMFVDASIVEIFINDGEEVFTSRIYPSKESIRISIFADKSADIKATMWDI